jgi:hypothetical protein
MPKLTLEQRKRAQDLTATEMKLAGARLRTFVVYEVVNDKE